MHGHHRWARFVHSPKRKKDGPVFLRETRSHAQRATCCSRLLARNHPRTRTRRYPACVRTLPRTHACSCRRNPSAGMEEPVFAGQTGKTRNANWILRACRRKRLQGLNGGHAHLRHLPGRACVCVPGLCASCGSTRRDVISELGRCGRIVGPLTFGEDPGAERRDTPSAASLADSKPAMCRQGAGPICCYMRVCHRGRRLSRAGAAQP